MAKKNTVAARISGGSPTSFEEKKSFGFLGRSSVSVDDLGVHVKVQVEWNRRSGRGLVPPSIDRAEFSIVGMHLVTVLKHNLLQQDAPKAHHECTFNLTYVYYAS
jgi:hypothetical protein